MTSAPPENVEPQGEESFAARLGLELQRARGEAAASATRLAFLCHSPDANPVALATAARSAMDAVGWLLGAATLASRK